MLKIYYNRNEKCGQVLFIILLFQHRKLLLKGIILEQMDLSLEGKRRIEDFLFFALFFSWFSLDFIYSAEIGNYTWGTQSMYLHLLSPIKYMLIFYILLFCRYNWKQWVVIGVTAAVLFYSARNSEMYNLFYVWLFIISAKGRKTDRILKAVILLSASFLFFIIGASLTGFLQNNIITRKDIIRYSLGFPHPNQLGFRFFILSSAILFVKREKLRAYHYIVPAISVIITFFVTNSRTASICIAAVTAVALFSKAFSGMKKQTKKAILFVCVGLALFFNIVPLIMSVFYQDNGIFGFADKMLSHRLLYSNTAFREFGTCLFGQKIYVTHTERLLAGLGEEIIIDNAYINILMRCGIIVYLLFSLGYSYSMMRHALLEDYFATLFMMIMAAYGAIELMFCQPMWNVYLLLIGNVFTDTPMARTIPKYILQLFTRKENN